MRRQETALANACLAGVIAAIFGCVSMTVQAQDLKKYDSSTKDFWLKPPPDWFLGDENKEQKGQTPNPGQPTPTPRAELDKILATIKLPPGFKIAVWADSVPQARQMAWGDKGTLFVGTFDKGTVHSVSGPDGQKVVKPFITGLRMPTGVAFQDGALYVVDIDKLIRYDNPEANLEKAPEGKVVYDDFPPYVPHGWKYLVPDGKGWFYIPVGVPCNICLPPASTGHYRRVDPKTGAAEIVALGVRNSVGGAVDPRSGQLWFTDNGRDWVSDDLPNDELNRVSKIGEHFGYPYCHQGDLADPKYGAERKCSEFTPPVYKQGPHIAGLGMKFYTGDMFPAEYKNGIFIAQHGSWNRAKKLGYRVLFLSVDPDGKNPKEQVFAGSWLDDQKILGRPADVLQAPDGSLLVADDQAGAIYRISYQK
ncbi:Glucose/arabinose dehydrogenase, beta-propeller fold [Rhodospirillales bacterium URHD0017]|nr:Glucose/arabinose dehydrogenase, beta-propeller fold [Rhodospirillales bacterium URHD0017]